MEMSVFGEEEGRGFERVNCFAERFFVFAQ